MKDLMKNHPERNIGNFSKGKKWFTNGKLNKFCYECPEGFWLGRTFSEEHRKNISRINSRLRRGSKASEETKAKMRANGGKAIGERNSNFRKKWWTNGLDNVLAFDCPFGYRKGRAISKETISKIQATKKLNKKPAWNKGMNKASQELYREKLQEKVRTSPVLANNSNQSELLKLQMGRMCEITSHIDSMFDRIDSAGLYAIGASSMVDVDMQVV